MRSAATAALLLLTVAVPMMAGHGNGHGNGGMSVNAKGEVTDPQLPFTVRIKDYGINGEVFSKSEVEEASKRLTTAVATVQSQFGSAEAIVPQAERAQESAGRVQVWRNALAAVGEKDTNDVVAAAKRVAADPAREGKLREELKSKFQAEMLQGFPKVSREDLGLSPFED